MNCCSNVNSELMYWRNDCNINGSLAASFPAREIDYLFIHIVSPGCMH